MSSTPTEDRQYWNVKINTNNKERITKFLQTSFLLSLHPCSVALLQGFEASKGRPKKLQGGNNRELVKGPEGDQNNGQEGCLI